MPIPPEPCSKPGPPRSFPADSPERARASGSGGCPDPEALSATRSDRVAVHRQLAPVVNVHVTLTSGLPAVSRMFVAPPISVTRYCVLAASDAFGLRIHWF